MGFYPDPRFCQKCKIFPFLNAEEHVRKGSNDIAKRHFRFLFESPRTGKGINI